MALTSYSEILRSDLARYERDRGALAGRKRRRAIEAHQWGMQKLAELAKDDPYWMTREGTARADFIQVLIDAVASAMALNWWEKIVLGLLIRAMISLLIGTLMAQFASKTYGYAGGFNMQVNQWALESKNFSSSAW